MKINKLEIIVCIIVFIIGIIFIKNITNNEINSEVLIENISNTYISELEKKEVNMIKVHVAGAVQNPGIISIEEGSRLADAIEKAGGFTDDADTSNLNFAYVIQDGEKIYIYNEDESKEIEEKGIVIEDSKVETKEQKININNATKEELETISGIGPALAERIIEYRNKNGKFKSIEDLKNVSGIGDKKFENIRNKIKV